MNQKRNSDVDTEEGMRVSGDGALPHTRCQRKILKSDSLVDSQGEKKPTRIKEMQKEQKMQDTMKKANL